MQLQVGTLLSEYVKLGFRFVWMDFPLPCLKCIFIFVFTSIKTINVLKKPCQAGVSAVHPRKTNTPTVVPDAGLRFENIDDDSSDSGLEQLLGWWVKTPAIFLDGLKWPTHARCGSWKQSSENRCFKRLAFLKHMYGCARYMQFVTTTIIHKDISHRYLYIVFIFISVHENSSAYAIYGQPQDCLRFEPQDAFVHFGFSLCVPQLQIVGFGWCHLNRNIYIYIYTISHKDHERNIQGILKATRFWEYVYGTYEKTRKLTEFGNHVKCWLDSMRCANFTKQSTIPHEIHESSEGFHELLWNLGENPWISWF